MIKVGLIGEDPYDTQAIKNLFLQKFGGVVSFFAMIKNKKGYQLDNFNTIKALKIEFEDKLPDYVIFIRDADAIVTEAKKIEMRQRWFDNLLPIVDNRGIFLLNIYELEALVLADIKTFNKIYNVNIKYNKNVLYQSEPKEFLKEKTFKSHKTYDESDAPQIFASLDFDTICNNCRYFQDFYARFRKMLQQ